MLGGASGSAAKSLQLGKASAIAVCTLVGACAGFYTLDRVRVAQRTAQLATLEAERDRLREQLFAQQHQQHLQHLQERSDRN